MKLLGFLLFLTIGFSAKAQCTAQAVSGGIMVNEHGYYLVNPVTGMSNPLIPATETAKKALEQLTTRDFISGYACSLIDSVVLYRIEFVGLYRLIGRWTSNLQVNISFQDYTRVSFGRRPGQGYTFKYALAPISGRMWRMFLSDDMSVTMGNITVEEEDAVMELFDPETGNLEERFSLKKVL